MKGTQLLAAKCIHTGWHKRAVGREGVREGGREGVGKEAHIASLYLSDMDCNKCAIYHRTSLIVSDCLIIANCEGFFQNTIIFILHSQSAVLVHVYTPTHKPYGDAIN